MSTTESAPRCDAEEGARVLAAARQAVAVAEAWAANPLDPGAQQAARSYLLGRAYDHNVLVEALFADGPSRARDVIDAALDAAGHLGGAS